MNTYDPSDGIAYVHLAPEPVPCPPARGEDSDCARLPAGYANGSPSTALRQPRSQQRKPAPIPPPQPSVPIPAPPGQASPRGGPEWRRNTTGRAGTA